MVKSSIYKDTLEIITLYGDSREEACYAIRKAYNILTGADLEECIDKLEKEAKDKGFNSPYKYASFLLQTNKYN